MKHLKLCLILLFLCIASIVCHAVTIKVGGFTTLAESNVSQNYYYAGFQNSWNTVDEDYKFTLLSDGITWEMTVPCSTINAGNNADEFKIVTSAGWEVNYGSNENQDLSGTMVPSGNNFLVPFVEGMYSYTIRIVPSTMQYTITINSSNVLTIGDDATSTTNNAPYNNYWKYATTQMLYTPAEISQGGTINSIAFKVAGSSSFVTTDLKVYLGHKSGTFSNTQDYVKNSNLTLVYSGKPTLGKTSGWETLTFNEGSFTYNGTDNLVVVVAMKSGGFNTSLNYYYYTGNGYVLSRGNDGVENYGDVTNTSYDYSQSTYRPSIKIGFGPAASVGEEDPFEDGDIFTANTAEGVEMTFKVISAANKTCQVGEGSWREAISRDWTGAITIPDEVNGLTVTSIGEYAFYYCPITSITIPNSVTSIGNNAFASSGLKSIIIPNSVTYIGDEIFGYCFYLSNITLSNTLSSIGNSAFDSCSALENITIPNSVTTIGNNAFAYCRQLTNIIIPNSVTSIGNDAFRDCYGLTSVTIPSSVTYIGEKALSGCSALTSIVVESGNTTYDSRNNCNAIIKKATNTLIVGCQNSTIPNTVRAIGDNAFYGCSNLSSISIPNSVTAIGDNAFSNCSNLSSISIPNSVTAIENGAFYGCRSLTSLSIPNSVTSIGDGAFSACRSLTSIVVENGNTVYDSRNNCNAIIKKATNTLIVGCQNSTIPNTVTAIGSSAFENCINLTNISIPNSVTSIGAGAFQNCRFTSLTIPNSVTTIGNSAFSGCYNLIGIVSEIEEPFAIGGVFSSYSLNQQNTILYVPAGTIEKYEALEGWSDFTKITAIPNVGDTFTANTAEGVEMTFLVTNATDKICSVYSIPSNTTGFVTIPNYANIYKVTSINNSAFQNNTGVTNIIIPNSVTSIGNNAFENCTGLASISIPNSVTSIGNNAFFGCTALTSIVSLIKNPFVVDANVFQYAGNNGNQTLNATLYIPKGTKSKYDNAQGWNQFANIIPNVFTVDYGDEINVTFMVTDETDKTCQVGTGFAPAIDDEMSDYNRFPIPLTANGYDVTAIADNAFANCKKLHTSYIGNNIKSIGENAFKGCGNLVIYSYIEEPFTIPENAFPNSSYLTIPYGTKSKYQETAGWDVFRSVYDETGIIDGITYDINGAHPDKGQPYTAWVESAIWNPYENNVIIPDTLSIGDEKFAVKGIDDGAFEGSLITMVSIPQSVTSIDSYAFANCTQLRHVYSAITDPSSCNISSYAFENLSSDATLYVPTDTKSLYENAPVWNKFTNIVEGKYILTDGDIFKAETTEGVVMTFKVISAENKTCQVGNGTNCAIDANISGQISIPDIANEFTVVDINDKAFYRCRDITSVLIPNSITTIGDSVFTNCDRLTSANIPNSVTSIGESAFKGCLDLTSIVVEDGNTVYDSRDNCNALIHTSTNTLVAGCNSTVIPNGVTGIGDFAFFGYRGLTSVVIPNSVTSIGAEAFYDCTGLTSVTSELIQPFVVGEHVFYQSGDDDENSVPLNATLYVPFGTIWQYEATEGWSQFANKVEMEADDPTLFKAEIADGVEAIFKITDETEKTCQIGMGTIAAINNSPSITRVALPLKANGYTITAIADNAFAGTGIISIYISNNIKSIGENAFQNCTSLKKVESYIEQPFDIPENAFSNISNEAELKILYGTKSEYQSCEGWNFPTITDEMAVVDGIRYSVCGSAAEDEKEPYTACVKSPTKWSTYEGDIVIPETITIGEENFTVTAIGDGAFESSQITAISIPQTVTSIETFVYCTELLHVYSFIEEPENCHVSKNAFRYLSSEVTLHVPYGTKELYQTAEGWKQFNNIVEIDWPDTDISEMENVLYVEDAECIADGRMTFYVKMKNNVVAEGFFFRLYLPEGFNFMENLEGKLDVSLYTDEDRFVKSNIEFNDPYIDEDGSLVVDAHGKNGYTISGHDGKVVRIRLMVPENMPVGSYPLLIKNGAISDNLGTMWPKGTKPVIKCSLAVVAKVRGDANADAEQKDVPTKDNDDVNAGDYVTITHYILGLPYDTLDMTAADANGDGVVNGADLTTITILKKREKVTSSAPRLAKKVEKREAE